MKSYDPENMEPRESYQFLTSLIVPRPIALVTSESRTGVLNCAPFSYFQGVLGKLPILSLSIARKKDRVKDTFRNIQFQSEFVVHVPKTDHLDEVETSSQSFPPDVSEVEEIGFTTVESTIVDVDGLRESPVRMECRLHDQQPIAGGKVTVVFGKVVQFHVDEQVMDQTPETTDYEILSPLARVGWDQYTGFGELLTPGKQPKHSGQPR